ncbi:unnamed protein product [Durusdinium trenchii]|uniref:FAD synthase n=2 Tax=Durusdinium trenchii TaxID=1381693 RepID=A0ABP0L053_9DINO
MVIRARECAIPPGGCSSPGVAARGMGGPLPRRAAACLGKFDALHVGHSSLIRYAREMSLDPWLISFSGMAEVFGWPERLPLVAPEHRGGLLNSFGAQERVLPFREVRGLSPEQFVDVLVDQLGVEGAVCGANFRFGFQAAAAAEDLVALGRRRGLQVCVAPLLARAGTVSSTRIRQLLQEGNLEEVAQMLGRPHRVLWHSLGESGQLQKPQNEIPGQGVYEVSLLRDGAAVAAAVAIQADGVFLRETELASLGAVDLLFDRGAAAREVESN